MNTSYESDFFPLRTTSVGLLPDSIAWAIECSHSIEQPDRQWQALLQSMALKGFEQWIQEVSLNLDTSYDEQQVLGGGSVNCQVGGFRLCVLVQGSLSDDVVYIPKSTVDGPHNFAHLYVLVEVEEEIDCVTVLSVLRCDRIAKHQKKYPWLLSSDGIYTVPLQCFDSSPEHLLLYLNCLNPAQLSPHISQRPHLVQNELMAPANSLVHSLGPKILNIERWVKNTLLKAENHFSWTVLPPVAELESAMAIRGSVEELYKLLSNNANHLEIPDSAIDFYVDCTLLELPLRLYAVAWPILKKSKMEWSLLLFLVPAEGVLLPPNISFTIGDYSSTLVSETLQPHTEHHYLYGQVVGSLNEQFFASAKLENGLTINWPPFNCPFLP